MEDDMDAGYESLTVIDRLLTNVDCIGVEKRTKPSKHQVYVLVVTWSDGVKYPIYRRYISFFDLKTCLKEEFKDRPDFKDPELPSLKHFERGWLFGNKEAATERRKNYINKFCQHVLQLPDDMVRSGTVVSFYETWDSDFEPESSQRRVSVPSAVPLSSLTPGGVQITRGGDRLSGRRGSQPQVELRYQNRDIPEIEESRPRRPRSSSVVQCSTPAGGPLADNRPDICRHSLPRGTSLDSADPPLIETQYRANSDYERRRPGEVDLKKGQLVEVLERSLTGWWFVHIDVAEGSRAEQGWAPGAFLDAAIPNFIKANPRKDSSGDEDFKGEYETVCEYEAQNEDELSYARGQRLQVTAPAEDGWWKVKLPDGESEAYTAAVNLQRTENKPDIAPKSTFQKRSLRGRGPPPRSLKGKGSADNPAKEDPHNLPIYAQVMKPNVKDPVTSREESSRAGDIPGAIYSNTDQSEERVLNYTDIVFDNSVDGVQSVAAIIQRIKKRDKVEYAEINPRPLPKMIGSHSKQHKGKINDGESHIYVNVAPANNAISQHSFEKVPLPPAGRTGAAVVAGGAGRNGLVNSTSVPHSRPQGAADTGHHHPSPVAETTKQHKAAGTQNPVPKPRKLGVDRSKPLPAYENTEILRDQAQSRQQEHIRPAAQLPPEAASAVVDDVESSRQTAYENHAVDFVNRIILSNRDPPPSSVSSSSPPLKPSSSGSALARSAAVVAGKGRVGSHATWGVTGVLPPNYDKNMATPGMNLGNIEPMMVQLPPAPAWPAPRPPLPEEAAIWWSRPDAHDSNMIEAAVDYKSDVISVLSFNKGELGVLVSKMDPNGWLGIKIGTKVGWVPSQCWVAHVPKPHTPKRKIKNIKQAETLHENQAWFLGKISRHEAEDLLLKHGQQRDFLIRESTNRVGDLTLSVRYQDRVRHFPIQMTQSGKYDIGKAHFTDLIKVVEYYQNNPLFFDENAGQAPVSLGRPINQPRTH